MSGRGNAGNFLFAWCGSCVFFNDAYLCIQPIQAFLAKPIHKSELVVVLRALGCVRMPPIGLLNPESMESPLRVLLVEDNPVLPV